MRVVEKKKWNEVQSMVKNMQGKRPQSEHCVMNAVKRVSAAGKKGVIKTQYKNCGRKKPEHSENMYCKMPESTMVQNPVHARPHD